MPPEISVWEAMILSDPAPILAFDTDYRIIAFNQAHNDEFFRVNGFHTQLGDIFPDLFVAEQRAAMRALMARALTGETFTVAEEFGRPELGSPPWAISYAPLRDAAGRVIGAFHRAEDIGDRIRAEAALLEQAALRESEARFRTIADHAPVMMWVTDPSGYCLYLNRRWYEFTGQSVAEAEGYGWLDATHPDDRARAERAFRTANAARETFRVEYRLRAADGSYRWAIDAASPRFDAEGGYLGYVGSVIEIDERRRAEERLRHSEEQLRLATDAAEVGLWDLDPTQDVLFWPTRVKAMFGISADAPIAMADFYRGLHPDDAERVAAAFRAAIDPARRALYDVEYRAIGKEDGIVRWVAAKGRALFDDVDGGRCVRVIGTAIDITERKRVEAELRALNDTLEQRVLAEIDARAHAQEQLRQAQKMEAVGQLTGGLAHDFNNLLTGISGSLELMRLRVAQGQAEQIERYITAAEGAAQRAAALTHRLLAFSRRQTLAPKATDVGQLVAGLDDLIRRTAGPAIVVESRTDPALWPSLIDPSQLENAILNLCINARDAMPAGGRITIETANAHLDARAAAECGVEAGDYVALGVSDTGEGMSPAVAAKAFDPFFTTKPIGMGTGLGLSMIYGFARQSGGSAHIASTVGQGTVVRIYMPRHHGVVAAPVSVIEPAPPRSSLNGETVLVIDDEPAVRMLVVEVLEDLGYVAIQAGDGAAGLEALDAAGRVDLLVTDVGLPGGLNGRQVADAARSLRPDLKVLFITGYAESAVLSNGLLDPGMAIMTKPFALDALAARIRALIEDGA